MSDTIIAPSLLASDFANLESEISMLNKSEAQWLHLDIMDGRFVPNISFGIPVVQAIRKHTKKILDCHLMIVEPEKYIPEFAKVGADCISFHFEACNHVHRTIYLTKDLGCKAGIVLNPHTPVNVLSEVIHDLDFVLLMSVNPGFGGQKFIENTYSKISQLKELCESKGNNIMIQVDGGVNEENASKLIQAGATNLVAGSSVFKSENPEKMISKLLNA